MLQTILGLYIQSLFLSAIVVILLSICWLFLRVVRQVDKTAAERQEFMYDLLMINVMTIPILSFGIVGILLMLKV